MALTESQRLELYELVKRSSLGKEGAEVVMEAIPRVDWNALSTHDDLLLVRTDLRAEMADLRNVLRAEMADLRNELRAEMADLRNELRAEMAAMETRLQRSIITWILAAQGVTLATISVLVTVLAFAVA